MAVVVCDIFFIFFSAVFAWEAYEKGADVHLQADPTKLELLKREYSQRKETHEDTKKNTVLDKYGGAEHLQAPPKELLLAQSVSLRFMGSQFAEIFRNLWSFHFFVIWKCGAT